MTYLLTCVAGEPSGDLLAAQLIQGVQQHPQLSDSRLIGIGGPRMQECGFESSWPMDVLSVRGYVEVLNNLGNILKIRRELMQRIENERPDVYIGIDAPDFNLTIEKKCRRLKIPTVHYISPSIWAWRGYRIFGIKKAVDHMLCIFPFEPKIYHEVGMKATYVGHPLANKIPMHPNPASAKEQLSTKDLLQYGNIDSDETIIAVLPGSRESEIQYIAKGFFKAMLIMKKSHGKKIRFLTPVATDKLRPALELLKKEALEEDPDIRIELITENSSLILEAADSVLIASGTATLEAALWKKPMVISYTVPWLTAQIMKRQGYLPYVGLPNILCQNFVVPELLQEEAQPEVLARGTLEWLDHPAQVAELVDIFEELHLILKQPTQELAASAIMQTIEQSGT
ncbi:MAG: lipid-A-disaccharide synthase [Betaproteobacteria bacterium]|jgi:lipid-A-disaccharide synthase